jgi:hypothetical protein
VIPIPDLHWYVLGGALVVCFSVLLTAADVWVFGLQADRRRVAALSVRWGFFSGVLVYAWLIDSHRVPYQEPAIWALLGVGMAVTGLLTLLRRRPQ